MEQKIEYKEITTAAPAKSSKKALWVLLIMLVVVIAGYFGLCAYANSLTTFYPGKAINGVHVGGMSADQAQIALEEGLMAQVVTVADAATGETLAELPLMELGYDVEDFSGDAEFWLETQQNENFVTKGWTYLQFMLGRYPGGSNWPDNNTDELAQTVTALQRKLEEEPIHAEYALEDNGIRYTKARDGRRLDAAQLAAQLCDAEMYRNGYRTEISFETVPAEEISAQTIYNALAGTVKNASYDIENSAILLEQVGVEFSVAAAQAAINGAEPGDTFVLEAMVERPAVTAAELEQILFRDVLGEWKTHVSGTAARINNVKLSAATINGYVMNAGDVFSYNEAVGQRTAANGYQAAPAYIRGETVDEIGGGICQTSSTLYYACLLAQVEIVERYPHRYVPAYIPWGMDATVSWGGPDYKFANNTIYPIKIVTEYSKGYLTVKLLGTQTLDTTVKMTNEVVSTTPWTTVYEVDETLAPGTPDKEKTTPYTGYKVKAYRNVYDKDGKLISTTLESNNDYKVRNKVIVQAPPAPTVSVPVVTDPVTGEVDVMVPELVQPESPAVVQPVPESVPDSSSPAEAPVE
jgi:vancomycin resistance protein YoaR